MEEKREKIKREKEGWRSKGGQDNGSGGRIPLPSPKKKLRRKEEKLLK